MSGLIIEVAVNRVYGPGGRDRVCEIESRSVLFSIASGFGRARFAISTLVLERGQRSLFYSFFLLTYLLHSIQ